VRGCVPFLAPLDPCGLVAIDGPDGGDPKPRAGGVGKTHAPSEGVAAPAHGIADDAGDEGGAFLVAALRCPEARPCRYVLLWQTAVRNVHGCDVQFIAPGVIVGKLSAVPIGMDAFELAESHRRCRSKSLLYNLDFAALQWSRPAR
jgi:hypothetical protein